MAICPIPRPEHPNPQWQRKHWKNLNGTWEFEIDHSCSGEERGLSIRIQREDIFNAMHRI